MGLVAAACFLVACGATPQPLEVASEAHAEEAASVHADDVEEELERDDEGWSRTEILASEAPFSRIGFMYDSPARAQVEVRSSAGEGDLGPWVPAEAVFDDEGAHNARVDVPQGTTRVQARLRATEGSLRNLTVMLVDPDPEERDIVQAPGNAQAAAPFVVSRGAWGARAGTCVGTHAPNRITVHHTVTANNDGLSMAARMRQIQSFHMDVNGWCDVGYHYLIGQDGKVYEGRPEARVGAHVGGNNTNNAGVAFIGTFTSVAPSASMFQAGASILADIAQRRGISIDADRIRGHRFFSATECPGNAFYPRVGELIDLAASGGVLQGSSLYADLPESHWAYEAASALRESGVLYGCAPGLFCPDQALTRAEVAFMLAEGLELPAGPGAPLFSDVAASHPAFEEIQALGAAGLTAGCGGGRYCPDESISRAQAAAFFVNAAGLEPLDGATPSFADVEGGAWYFGVVEAGYEAGIISGCATGPLRYCPDDAVTRAQAAVLHVGALGA